MGVLKIAGVLILLGLVYTFGAPYAGLLLSPYFHFMKFGTNWMSEKALTLIPGFFLLNIVVIHFLFRFRFTKTLLCAFLIASLGAFSVYLIMEYKLAPVRDAYSINTSVFTNAAVQLSCLAFIALFKRYKYRQQ